MIVPRRKEPPHSTSQASQEYPAFQLLSETCLTGCLQGFGVLLFYKVLYHGAGDAYFGRQVWEVVCGVPAGVFDLTGFRSQVATLVICGKGDHERVRERPRLAPEVPDVRYLDPDLLAHLADDGLFYRLAWLDEASEHAVEPPAGILASVPAVSDPLS